MTRKHAHSFGVNARASLLCYAKEVVRLKGKAAQGIPTAVLVWFAWVKSANFPVKVSRAETLMIAQPFIVATAAASVLMIRDV
jgi:hypothetical protein